MAILFFFSRFQASAVRLEPFKGTASVGKSFFFGKKSPVGHGRLLICTRDPGIQERVDNVHDKIHEDEDHRINDHGAHDEQVVAIEGRLDEKSPEPWNAENLLDDHRTGDDTGKSGSHEADHRQQSTLHHMLGNDHRLLEALGTGRPDKVGSQIPPGRRPRQPRDIGEMRKCQRQCRHQDGDPAGLVRNPPRRR